MYNKLLKTTIILYLFSFPLINLSLLKTDSLKKEGPSLSTNNIDGIDFSENLEIRTFNTSSNILRDPSVSDWTIIHYIDGDNNLDPYFIPSSSGSDAYVDVIALDDGDLDGDTHAYHVFSGSNVEIPLSSIQSSWTDELNMGDPYTLVNFSRYCIDNYPSDCYLIIPQDHGGAWKGCCRDDTSLEDCLNISDLKTAFSSIASYLGRNIDVVLFNDCLMSSVEIAIQLYPYVDYMVGAETVSWVDTWDNCDDIIDIIKANHSITPQELSIEIVNLANLHDSSRYNAQLISAINSNKIPSLQDSINDLATELINKLIKYQIEIENARLASREFEGPRDDVYELLIDLYDFAENIYNKIPDATIQNYALNIMNNIGPDGGGKEYIILKERNTYSASFCHGLSLYFPPSQNLYNILYTIGNDFTTNTNWDEFLKKYWEITSNSHPDTPYSPTPSDGAIEIIDDTIDLSVNVSDADGDIMDVYFYNASDNCLIGVDNNVNNGDKASVTWSDFIYGKTYEWYVKSDDGKINTTSPKWSFTIPYKTLIDETDGIYNFTIKPLLDDFDVNVSISVLDDSLLYYTGADKNPTNISLLNTLMFFYINLNDSSNLDGFFSFTVYYNNSEYNSIKIWWFNNSANNFRGKWQEVDHLDLSSSLIKININHMSIFALTEEENQISNISADDNDNKNVDNKETQKNIIIVIMVFLLGLIGTLIITLYLARKVNKNLSL